MRIRVWINIMKILHLHYFCFTFLLQWFPTASSKNSALKFIIFETIMYWSRYFSFDEYITSNELKCKSSNFKDRTIIIPRKRFLWIKTFRIVYTRNVIASSSHKNYWLNHKFCKLRPYDKYLCNPSLFITK